MAIHDPHFDADDLAPIDVRIAPGLRKAFPPVVGCDDRFRTLLEALSRVGRTEGQSKAARTAGAQSTESEPEPSF